MSSSFVAWQRLTTGARQMAGHRGSGGSRRLESNCLQLLEGPDGGSARVPSDHVGERDSEYPGAAPKRPQGSQGRIGVIPNS